MDDYRLGQLHRLLGDSSDERVSDGVKIVYSWETIDSRLILVEIPRALTPPLNSPSQEESSVSPESGPEDEAPNEIRRRPHECDYQDCHKTYSTSSSLKRHQREKHQPTRSLKCKSCKKAFARQYRLDEHEASCRRESTRRSITFQRRSLA